MKENDWENDPVEEISAEDIQAECKRAFFYAYNECNGAHESIAKLMGISVGTVNKKCKEYGLQ